MGCGNMVYRIKRRLFLGILIMCMSIGCIWIVYQTDKGNDCIVINEICSHNQTVIYDGEGEYSDYVELYNYSNKAIDLSGYYLSDSRNNTNTYVIKDMVLEAGGYELIYLKVKNGFSLSDGEAIYLSNSQGKILDSVEIPTMDIDKVYARNVNTGKWENAQIPTPFLPNEEVEVVEKKITEDENAIPKFSVASGFYDEEFMLEISALEGYDIYYTLDGSTPTEESICYMEPILIEDVSNRENMYANIKNISVEEAYTPDFPVDKCNVVRAVAISREDGAYSQEAYASYFVSYDDRYGYEDIYKVSLVTDPENLFSNDKGIYVIGDIGEANWDEDGSRHSAITNYSSEGKGWRRDAHVEVFDKKGIKQYSEDLKISIHGGWSVLFNQKSFNLIGESKEDGTQNYVFSGLFGDKSTSLMLRAGGYRDLYSTKFRDALNHEMVEDRDLTILKSIPCQVFLNGEYWGMYNLQERIDQGLIENEYGVNAEDVIILKNSNVVGGDDADYQLYAKVVEYAKNHDLSVPAYYREMEKMIDIQSYIDYYCFQIYVANCDAVANNYSCWRTKTITDEEYYDGKWRWVLYDTDDSLGMVDGLACHYTDSFKEGHWTTNPMQDTLFRALLDNEDYKRQFVETFLEMADANFDYESVNALLKDYCDEYMKASVVSHQRFIDEEYTEEQYLEEVEVIREFFYKRKDDIIQYMLENFKIENLQEYLES